MNKSIRWGILGLGKIAHKFAADLIKLPQCELIAVGSSSINKAKAFATQFYAEHAFGSYEDLVRCPEIDVIYIATPHTYHKKHTLLCLEAGKHVLCEKPFALNQHEVAEMNAKAEQQKLFLMEAIWTRFLPFMDKLLALINENAIGAVKYLEADFGFLAPYDPQGRLYNPHLGGGALLDIGIYPLFLAHALFGIPSHIQASALMSDTHIDTVTNILLRWRNDQLANLHCSVIADTPTQAKIYGTKGKIIIPTRWHEAKSLTLITEQGEESFSFDDDYLGFAYEIMEVNECIRNGALESNRLPLTFSVELIKTMDSVRRLIGLKYPNE